MGGKEGLHGGLTGRGALLFLDVLGVLLGCGGPLLLPLDAVLGNAIAVRQGVSHAAPGDRVGKEPN